MLRLVLIHVKTLVDAYNKSFSVIVRLHGPSFTALLLTRAPVAHQPQHPGEGVLLCHGSSDHPLLLSAPDLLFPTRMSQTLPPLLGTGHRISCKYQGYDKEPS